MMSRLSMQKKNPLIFASAILTASLGLVTFSHAWLYLIFQQERIKQITRQVFYTKKIIEVSSREQLSLNALITNLRNGNIKEKFFVLDKKFKVLHPKGGGIVFEREKQIAKNLMNKWKHPETFASQKSLGRLDFLFNVESREKLNSVYYVLTHQNILPQNITSFFVLLYITIILLSLLAWFISRKFVGRFFSIILAITQSLRYYSQNQHTQMIDYDKKDEIGELIATYNQFMEHIEISREEQLTQQFAAPAVSTQMSTSKPVPKSVREGSLPPKFDNIEISLFPRKSNDDNRVSTIFQKGEGHELHCLVLETYVHNQSSTAWKERLKDYFIELTQNNFEPEEIIVKLLGSTRKADNDSFRSSLFYGNFNTATSEMLLFKAGHFSLYTQNSSQKLTHLNIGSIDLSTGFTSFAKEEFKPSSYFFLFTSEFLKSFGVRDFDLEGSAFSSLNQNINSARGYLIEILQKLYDDSSILSIGDKPLGRLLLLFHNK